MSGRRGEHGIVCVGVVVGEGECMPPHPPSPHPPSLTHGPIYYYIPMHHVTMQQRAYWCGYQDLTPLLDGL